MITFSRALFTCSVCGKETEYILASGSDVSGSPDIDLRPPETERNKIPFSIQECPGCGYINRTIEDKLSDETARAMLRSERYAYSGEILFRSDMAARFYRYYLLCKKMDREKEARNAITSAAWMCDDAGDRDSSIRCRKIAAELIREQFILEPSFALAVLWAEHMRRAEEFDQVLKETEGIDAGRGEEEILKKLLAFERTHAEMRDAGCYTVEFALREMEKPL